MNKSFFAALVTLVAQPIVHPPVARADSPAVVCRTPDVADAGYIFAQAADGKTAQLAEETFVGSRKLADLDCERLPVNHFPDSLDNYAVCRDARAPQSGLIVRLYVGGIAGLPYASVLEVLPLARPQEREVLFGHLNCR